MNNQNRKRLGDIVNFKRGYDLPSYNRRDGKYPIISSGGISGYHSEYKKDGEGLITGRYGTLGEMYYVNGKYWPHNTALYATDFKGNFPKYVYYLMKCLGNLKTSDKSTVPGVNRNDLHEIIVPYINPEFQQKIATVLSSLDSKIELNNRINAELEAMAKTLYDYWFVQFDFPDINGKPYKTSGGKMVWNEELKREIPVGWAIKEMNKLLVKNNLKYDHKGEGKDTIDLSVMPSGTMCLYDRNHSSSFSTNLFYLKKYDILFGSIRPYLLKAGFAPFDGLITGTVHSYRTVNPNYYNFSILTMIHDSIFNHAMANSKGTKMPVIGSDDLLGYKVAVNEEVICLFNNHFSFKELIANNINENQKLTELRDWLLPMLMNGQVKIK